jgi:hypothetical protein
MRNANIQSYMKLINIFAFLLIFFSQSVTAQDNLNKEWLDKDRQIFNSTLLVLEKGEFDLNTLKNLKDIKASDEDGNLGLGYKRTAYYYGGGYTAVTFKLLLDPDNNIIKHRITVSGNLDAFNVLDKEYQLYNALKKYIKETYANRISLTSENTDSELFSKMIICFNEYFGINEKINIPKKIYSDYSALIDPFDEDVYGFIVGLGGDVPDSRSAIERIKKEKNKDILKFIMASPNPTGRIYAIEAISGGKINNIIKNKEYSYMLNKLIQLKIPIEAGSGCIVRHITIDSYEKVSEAMKYVLF